MLILFAGEGEDRSSC